MSCVTNTGRTRRNLLLPPLQERLATEEPVFTHEQAADLTRRIMRLTTVEHATVTIRHIVRNVTRFATDKIQNTDDGDMLSISLRAENQQVPADVFVTINQLDQSALADLVARADSILKAMTASDEKVMVEPLDEQDTYRPVKLWHDSTVAAIRSARESIPKIVQTVRSQQGAGAPFHTSGFVAVTARADAMLSAHGITAYCNGTDSEVSITVRPEDGKVSGWQGQAHRDWNAIDPVRVAAEATDIAARSIGAVAVEPGRRTAILAPGAVVQLMRFLVPHFNFLRTTQGDTGFSKIPNVSAGAKWEQQIFDTRVQITSDPADPEGGYMTWFGDGYANPQMTWIDHGKLRNLAITNPSSALDIGKPYSEYPFGLRLHGGEITLEQMIAQTEEGIYVHRVSGTDIVDMTTGVLSGVTRDGCFLVRKGKIDRPVKNFRFLTSPFFFLNTLMGLGPTRRAAFGYAPATALEAQYTERGMDFFEWPRWPMIVPPLLVSDFNFTALIDSI